MAEKKRFFLTTMGGLGDCLQVTMAEARMRQLYPDCEIDVSGRSDSIRIFDPSRFHKILERRGWHDVPCQSPNYDLVIDFRYSAKTLIWKDDVLLDVPKHEVLDRQRAFELDLYVVDFQEYRMKNWNHFMEKIHAEHPGWRWHDFISYTSGLSFDPSMMHIATEEIPGRDYLPKDGYICISAPTPMRGLSKLYPFDKLNRVIASFPNETFVCLGVIENKEIKGHNVIHAERSFTIQQTAWVLKQSKMLLAEEGGLVHVARAVGCPSVVLFGPTQDWFFGYAENVNLRGDHWCWFCHNQSPFWYMRCAINRLSPFCMALENLKEGSVTDAIRGILEKRGESPNVSFPLEDQEVAPRGSSRPNQKPEEEPGGTREI